MSENTTSDYPQIEEAFREELKALSGIPDDPQIVITETYHIPGDYMVKDADLLKSIVDASRDKTRSKILFPFPFLPLSPRSLPVPGDTRGDDDNTKLK